MLYRARIGLFNTASFKTGLVTSLNLFYLLCGLFLWLLTKRRKWKITTIYIPVLLILLSSVNDTLIKLLCLFGRQIQFVYNNIFVECGLRAHIIILMYLLLITLVTWTFCLLLLCGDVHTNPGPASSGTDDSNTSYSSHDSHNCLSIMHLNIRSIRNKKQFIEDELLDFDILCFTETHLAPDYDKSQLFLDGFNPPLYRDRTNFGGGVMTYVSSRLSFRSRDDLMHPSLEMVWVEVFSKNKSIMVGTVYRSQIEPISFWNNLNISIEKALGITKYVVIVGDLNENLLNTNLNNLRDIIMINNLTNLISCPTRVTHNSSTLLDPILVTNDIQFFDSGVIEVDENISDHRITYLTISLGYSLKKSFKRQIWLYEQSDFNKLNNLINLFDWETFFSRFSDANIATTSFTDKILQFSHECIPTKTVTIRPGDKPWYDNKIRNRSRKRDRLKKKAIRLNTQEAWNKYKRCRKTVNNLVKRAKEIFYSKLDQLDFKYNDQKQFWKTIKFFMKDSKSNHIPPLMKDNATGSLAYSDNDKANTLNEYFTGISHLDTTGKSLPFCRNRTDDVFPQIMISRDEIIDTIQSLPTNKATGPDNISHRLLKATSYAVSRPLMILYNLSLSSNCFPSGWKVANVVPIFKKGDRSLPCNYRPVSLVSCVGKLMERIVFKLLYNFLHERELINKYQSGFQPGHSTVFQLLEIFDRICKSLDNMDITCMVFCDISKAFDRVWHDGLLQKLQSYGIRNGILRWFRSYLTNRSQCVVLNSSKSSLRSVTAGVPQGSVLGPLLFLIYINDISDKLTCFTRLYADDSSLLSTSKDIHYIENEMNNDLKELSEWSNKWLITFNPDKTEAMLFSNRLTESYPEIKFENRLVKYVDTHKHLGLSLSSNAKWNDHIDNLMLRCSKMVGILRKLKFTLSRKCLNAMYLSFVRPILEYADVVWDGITDNQSCRLERLQNEAARMVTGLTRSTKLDDLYAEVGWTSLSERRKVHKLSTFYKIVNGLVPSYLTDILPPSVGEYTNRALRNSTNFRAPLTRHELYRKSFFPSMIILWNKLPNHVKESENITSFKKQVSRIPPPVPKQFLTGDRKYSVLHARIRNKCSNLNDDLFNNHLSLSPLCSCGIDRETSNHYFLVCPIYNTQRLELLRKMHQCRFQADIDSILFGSNMLTQDQNCELFEFIHDFIKETNRFG